MCPAGVDVPGYMALVGHGRYDDAVRLIRKDNPFPIACAYICEHPCEARCRRRMIDDAINVRGLKRYAVDHAGDVPNPPCAPDTGKRVAIIGGGPSGLSCAYYLSLMGHKVTVYEEKARLGGMLRYGIPNYRLPRELLDKEINTILSTGIEVKTGITVGKDVTFEQIQHEYDCLYIAIGAHQDKKTGIPGEDSKNVISAVELLREIGDDIIPDFTGKQIVVIGGGNVAMDVTRSAVRLGAEKVTCVYRRRIEDMTALPDEVTGAMAEGVEMVTLAAPVRIESDENGVATALWVQPQLIGEEDNSGRPRPGNRPWTVRNRHRNPGRCGRWRSPYGNLPGPGPSGTGCSGSPWKYTPPARIPEFRPPAVPSATVPPSGWSSPKGSAPASRRARP
jgi:NADPH-dependent glutamate synthase beta subunit-like oxidoreductase